MSALTAIVPKAATLWKYGLSTDLWLGHLRRQGGTCGCCHKLPKSRRLNVDHQHVPNYFKLPPLERLRFVRGLLCFGCNHKLLMRGVTVEKLQGGIDYLTDYQHRQAEGHIV